MLEAIDVRPSKIITFTLLLFASVAAADEPVSQLSGRVVDQTNGGPVEGAQVYVSDAAGVQRVLVTDRAGHYAVTVTPGDYDVAITYGSSRTEQHVSVEPARAAVVDGKVDSTSGEVIIIQEKRRPAVLPAPKNFSKNRNPPYSQEALDKDAWTRAWMVLDISPTGEVKRFKFLKRPGYDLEKIAADEVFKLSFTPARDENGKAVETWLVWNLEWPSNGWLMMFNLPRTTRPPVVGFPPHRLSDYVPCKGSGPMNLGSLYPTYRDCSTADLKRMPNEPWIAKP